MSQKPPPNLDDFRKRLDERMEDVFRDAAPDQGTAVAWDPPLALEELARPPFPVDALPQPVRGMVEAVAEDTQTPPDLAAIIALGTISASVGGKAEIEVRGTWREPVHTQAFCALGSGNRKTAVVRHLTKPLSDMERKRAAEDRRNLLKWKSDRRVKELMLKKLEAQAAEPEKPGKPRAADLDLQIRALTEELADEREPKITQFIVDDITPEKLAVVMFEQGGAIAAISAEGGFIGNMTGRYSDVPNLEPMLKGHSCDPMPVGRMGRESSYLPRPVLTIALAPQPIVITDFGQVRGVTEKGASARLLPSFPSSYVGSRRLSNETRPVPDAVATHWAACVSNLIGLKASTIVDDDGYALPHVIRLSPVARSLINLFESEVEPRLLPGGDLGHIDGWGSKIVGAAARIAGLLHLARHAFDDPWNVEVSAETMDAAITIARYHIAHALIYFDVLGEQSDTGLAREVLAAILSVAKEAPEGSLVEGIRKQAVYQKLRKRQRFQKAESLNDPLATLEDLGFLRVEKVASKGEKGQGRAKELIFVNPYAFDRPVSVERAAPDDPPYKASSRWRTEAFLTAEELMAAGDAAIEQFNVELTNSPLPVDSDDYRAARLALILAQRRDAA